MHSSSFWLKSDGKHTLITTYYSDDSYKLSKYNIYASKTEVIDSMKNKVSEFENINHDGNIFSVVEHSNGKNYLIFSIDLYGYSIMETIKTVKNIELHSDLLAVMSILAGDKFTSELVKKYVRREILMNSPIYNEWVEEERKI